MNRVANALENQGHIVEPYKVRFSAHMGGHASVYVVPKRQVELEQRVQRLEAENERLLKSIRDLEWLVLGYGWPYPPDDWDSFDDFTDLLEN